MDLENIVVDITQRNYNTIQTIQYDVDSRYVNVKIVSSGKNVDLTNYMVSIACRKPDGKIVFNETEMIEPKQGLIKFLISEQITTALGEVVCELKIYGKNSSVLTTQYFTINVTKPIADKTIQSTNEFRQLTIAMNDYNAWVDKVKDKYDWLEEEYAEELSGVKSGLDETNAQLSDINNHVTEVVNVKNYGVDSTGSSDCSTIVQELIDSGYSLYFPRGKYRLNIHIKTGVTLQGEGLTLVTLLANDMNHPVIKSTRQDYGYEIKDLTINGRNEMGKGSTTGHGIHLTNEGELAAQDLEPLIENVKIINVHTGLRVDATVRGGLFKNIKAGACKIGINHLSTDCIFKDCITAQTQSHGIYNLQGNNTFISCKAFLAGLNKTEGAGMKNQGSFNRIINCEFQQNVLENLHLQNANHNIIQGCVLDGAGYGSKNYFPSLQYTENGGGVVPLSNLRMYNSHGNMIDCTIINGRLDSYAKTGFYNQYVGEDKDNFIRLTINDTSSDGVMTNYQFDDVDKYTQNNEIYINSKKLYSKKMNTVTAIDNQVEILSGGFMEVNGMVFVNIEFKCLKTQSWGSEIIQGLPSVRFNTPLSCNKVDKTLNVLTSGKITINPSMTENEIIRVSGFYLLK